MKIEVGKSYINDKGDVVKITKQVEDSWFPFECTRHSYTEVGEVIIDGVNPQDLICEVVPEIYERYVLGYILTQEAFIEKHIKYWTEYE